MNVDIGTVMLRRLTLELIENSRFHVNKSLWWVFETSSQCISQGLLLSNITRLGNALY